jgi:hypothetical protein
MKKLFSLALLMAALSIPATGLALDAVQQRYITMLTTGGPFSIREAAASIYNTGEKYQTVLDTMAEVLLENYKKTDRNDVDAMSWIAKALGRSGNPRYHDALKEAADKSGQRKLEKYASQALEELGNPGSVSQYQKGMVSLASLKKEASKAEKPEAPVARKGGRQPLSVVKEGMSMQEVYDLVGPPTATTTYQTGKAWIPFNFRGSDSVRTLALYKGQGRVVFSNQSNYSGVWRVIEVQLNKDESGYP